MKAHHTSPLAAVALITCVAALIATHAAQAGGPVPGHSRAFGKSLAEWQEVYWRWAFGQLELPVDPNGNAVVGRVVLMPLPSAPGDGTPGEIDVTLSPGQPFVLPLFVWLGTSYDDGTPDDPALDLNVFQTLEITLKIDGVTVVNGDNVLDYYSDFTFDPEIPLPPEASPYEAIIWLQGIGIVHPPLSAGRGGQHTITLDVRNTIPVADALGNEYLIEYHNTWNVTVSKR